jgi:surface antigen
MSFKKIAALLTVSTFLFACQSTDMNNMFTKENIGAATGAVGGAWIGSNVGKGKGNIAAIALGTLLGAKLGQSVGASLDRADIAYYNQTSQSSLETSRNGTTSSWANPNNGHSGSITPIKTYQTSNGTHCRQYSQTVTIDGQRQEAYGTACRQQNGSWQITQ